RQRHAQLRSHLLVGRPGGARQYDPASQRQRLGALGPPRPAPQRLALIVGQDQRRFGSSCPRHPLTLQHFSKEFQAQHTRWSLAQVASPNASVATASRRYTGAGASEESRARRWVMTAPTKNTTTPTAAAVPMAAAVVEMAAVVVPIS